MKIVKTRVVEPCCPFCRWIGVTCKHFIGWTDDGKEYESYSYSNHWPIPENAVIVKTGVTARVYLPETSSENKPR